LARIISADRMRQIEAECFAESLPAETVMESAGRAVFDWVFSRLRATRGARVLVVCGKGNNGADGMVAARLLSQAGASVALYLIEAPSDDRQLTLLDRFNIERVNDLALACARADVVIDAMLGIGARQPLKPVYAKAVRTLNAHARFILAVDVPSGVCATEGECVQANATLTFHAYKQDMLQLPQREACGDMSVADIGIPDAYFNALDGHAIDARFVHAELPLERKPAGRTNAHKGTFGHVALMGGAAGKTGAMTLAALGALRAGAGLATVVGGIKGKLPPEIMTSAEPDGKYSAWCVGPGGSVPLEKLRFIREPMVIDADALNALAQIDWRTSLGPGPRVLTPHPLELSRLLGRSVEAIQSARLGAALEAATGSGAIVVLKGANTIIAEPNGHYGVSMSGGRELAKGGSGDVLAGIIAGLLAARGASPFVAAAAGVYLHGLAGTIAGSAKARASVLASDLCASVADAMRSVEQFA
jgi:NAD(P)H-hydrate epimerase